MKPIVITGMNAKILLKDVDGEIREIPVKGEIKIYAQPGPVEDLPTTPFDVPVENVSVWDGWKLGGGDIVASGDISDAFYEALMRKKISFTMARNFRFPPIKSIKHHEYLSSLEWGDKENIMWYPRIRATTQLVWPLVERIDP